MNTNGHRHGFGRLLRPISFVGWWANDKIVGNAYAIDGSGKLVARKTGWHNLGGERH